MKLNAPIKNNIVTVICYLFVLLFVYAAVSKFLDFENFQVQLGQSPLLSAFAGWVSWGVLLIELLTAGLLMFYKTRCIGLYIAFILMVMFTTYIYIILNYSDFIPCSCGGVLEKMGWTEHLVFNISFIVLAFVGILLFVKRERSTIVKNIFILLLLILGSIGVLVALFLLSENIIKKENNFIRRFHQHPVIEDKSYNLEVNSYYFAGFSKDKIYLGNYTAPLLLTSLDTAFIEKMSFRIRLDNTDYPFNAVKIKVKAPHYYVYDGNVPVIYRGRLNDSLAQTISFNDNYFSQLEVIDSVSFAFRTQSSKSQKQILGTLNLNQTPKTKLHYNILETQQDGVFDADGQLIQDYTNNQLVYIYYYKNKFLIMNPELKVLNRLNTIDTISKANIKVKSLSDGRHQLKEPPLIVNKNTALYSQVMFNESNLMGKFESRELWEKSSIIDMYKTDKKNYLGSFFIQNRGKNKMSQILVTDKHLFVLSGNEIVRYRFAQSVTKNFIKGDTENP